MFIETEPTPNPATLKFLPGRAIMNGSSHEFASPEAAEASPLAEALFDMGDVNRVLFGDDFIAVTLGDGANWSDNKPQVVSLLLDHFVSEAPLFYPEIDNAGAATGAEMLHQTSEEDEDIVAQISDLLETRVRPALAADGGDVTFRGYHDGVAFLQMQGACVGCPSATATLKHGIEGLLKHYIPQLREVRSA